MAKIFCLSFSCPFSFVPSASDWCSHPRPFGKTGIDKRLIWPDRKQPLLLHDNSVSKREGIDCVVSSQENYVNYTKARLISSRSLATWPVQASGPWAQVQNARFTSKLRSRCQHAFFPSLQFNCVLQSNAESALFMSWECGESYWANMSCQWTKPAYW